MNEYNNPSFAQYKEYVRNCLFVKQMRNKFK
jgi:hypothetical protein